MLALVPLIVSSGVALAFNTPPKKKPLVLLLRASTVAPPLAAMFRLVSKRTPVVPFEVPLIVTVPAAFSVPLTLAPYRLLPEPFRTMLPPETMRPVK